jgi:hypothetical protein
MLMNQAKLDLLDLWKIRNQKSLKDFSTVATMRNLIHVAEMRGSIPGIQFSHGCTCARSHRLTPKIRQKVVSVIKSNVFDLFIAHPSTTTMSARLIPGLAARFAQPVPLRTVVRQFSSTVRVATSSSASSSTQRLGSQQFFTSSQPKIQFLAGALGKLGARSALAASSGIVRTAGRPAWSPSSFTAAFFRRAFSSSRQGLARPSYSPRGGGGWQPPPPPSFWAKLRARINGIEPPHLVYGIIGLNLAIFGLWAYAINSYVSSYYCLFADTKATLPGPVHVQLDVQELYQLVVQYQGGSCVSKWQH